MEENQWGKKKEDYYGDEEESQDEEDEYNEVLRLQQIRAQKMKLAEKSKMAQIEVEETKEVGISESINKELFAIAEVKEGDLPKPENLPPIPGQVPENKELVSEYAEIYGKILQMKELKSDKSTQMCIKVYSQYANCLAKLIQARSEERETGELVEDLIRAHRKLIKLSSLQINNPPTSQEKPEPQPIIHKKVVKRSMPEPTEIKPVQKKVKTACIISGNKKGFTTYLI